jgi:hypothetical protein
VIAASFFRTIQDRTILKLETFSSSEKPLYLWQFTGIILHKLRYVVKVNVYDKYGRGEELRRSENSHERNTHKKLSKQKLI